MERTSVAPHGLWRKMAMEAMLERASLPQRLLEGKAIIYFNRVD
jgi:hypothetical protein